MTDYTRDYGTEEDMVAQKISPESREMVKWFLQNYEDPVESCPYSSVDGGYEFIYGGPYIASDELVSQYGDSPFLEEATNYLDEMCIEWSAMPKDEDEDEDDSIPDTEDLMDTEDLWGEE